MIVIQPADSGIILKKYNIVLNLALYYLFFFFSNFIKNVTLTMIRNRGEKMKVNDFAKQLGIAGSKIRYYDRMGLIQGKRCENNYRDFDENDALSIYHAQMLRSFDMSVQESLEAKDKELQEIDGWVIQHEKDLSKAIQWERMKLRRLEEMHRYFETIHNADSILKLEERDESYNLWNLKKGGILNQDKLQTIALLSNQMPFSYVAIRITEESLLKKEGPLDIQIGLGILKRNKTLLNLNFPDEVEMTPGSRILSLLLESKDPFNLNREDLKPLFHEIQRCGYGCQGDLIGRLYLSYMKNGEFVHGIGLAAMIK